MSDDHLYEAQVSDNLDQWEVISSAASDITLAALFKICIEAFELIRSAKSQDIEFKKLDMKLTIEKCRLRLWGQTMGLESNQKSEDQLTESPLHDRVCSILRSLRHLVTDGSGLSSKYGCRKVHTGEKDSRLLELDAESPVEKLSEAFCNFNNGSAAYKPAKQAKATAYWMIHDRAQFLLLINESSNSISGLQDTTKDVVSRRQQERLMNSRILSVHDQETLSIIREVCDSDHPGFSDAASCRMDAFTIASTVRQNVSVWVNSVESDSEQGSFKVRQKMEDWSYDDLRQNYLALMEQHMSEPSKPDTVPCTDCGSIFLTGDELQKHVESPSCPMCGVTYACKGLLVQHACFNDYAGYWGREIQRTRRQEQRSFSWYTKPMVETPKPRAETRKPTFFQNWSTGAQVIQDVSGPPFRCSRCYDSFDGKWDWAHHTTEENNVCRTCDRKFPCPQNLLRHIATSAGH